MFCFFTLPWLGSQRWTAPVLLFYFFFWWNQFLKPQQKGKSRNCSNRVDDNHRLAVNSCESIFPFSSLFVVCLEHSWLPLPFFSLPLSYCLSLSLSSSFPLVLNAVIIPLFFEVSINSSPPSPTNSPQTYEYMVFLSAGVRWGSP